MDMKRFPVLFFLLLTAPSVFSFEPNVLPPTIEGVTPAALMTHDLRQLTYEACDRRDAQYEDMKTPEQLKQHQSQMRLFFLNQLGPFPENNPLLNAQIVDRRTFDDYRIEKIIFDSQPHYYVTAVLYLPKTKPPYPGVLFPCGHSDNGKASETYQRACILLAKNGFAVLCYDPIDQGERYQLLKEDGTPEIGGTLGHTVTGVGSILLGRNTATFRIWDGICGLDYLASREDIDPNRIGCTGNSGGGTLTSYLMAIDPRIACAVPGCYLTTLRNQEPQDAEQNIHAQIAFGMDHAEFLMMRAPKPTLMCTATHDFFDINGAWYTFRQAKRFYTRMGYPEHVDLIETDAEHGFSKQLREGMVRWMLRWLCGKETTVTEPDFPILSDEEMQCTPKGQVMLLEGARSVYDLNRDLEKQYQQKRKAFWIEAGKEKALEKVRELIGLGHFGDLPNLVNFQEMGHDEFNGFVVDKFIFQPKDGIDLPILFFHPKPPIPNKDIVLYVNGAGKAAQAVPGGDIDKYLQEGKSVFAVDVRGTGETAHPSNNPRYDELFGNAWEDYFSAYMLDKTYVGMRVTDIIICAQYLHRLQLNGSACKTFLVAVGETGVPALHAAALEPQLFEHITIKNSLASWSDVIQHPMSKNQLINAVHGALQYYDLPDLAATLPAEKLTLER